MNIILVATHFDDTMDNSSQGKSCTNEVVASSRSLDCVGVTRNVPQYWNQKDCKICFDAIADVDIICEHCIKKKYNQCLNCANDSRRSLSCDECRSETHGIRTISFTNFSWLLDAS